MEKSFFFFFLSKISQDGCYDVLSVSTAKVGYAFYSKLCGIPGAHSIWRVVLTSFFHSAKIVLGIYHTAWRLMRFIPDVPQHSKLQLFLGGERDTLTEWIKVYWKANTVLSNSDLHGKIKVSNSARKKLWVSWPPSIVGSFHGFMPKSHTGLWLVSALKE